MTPKGKQARDKIIEARTRLLVTNGFFGFLALQLRLIEAEDVLGFKNSTMMVDGKNLFFNPDFTLKLSPRELQGVICHEIMHCALQHFSRRGSRNPKIWNIAGDFAINIDIIDSGGMLPGDAISLDDVLSGAPKKGHLYDIKLKDKNTETIYEMLMDQIQTITITINMQGMDPGECGGVLDAPGNATEKADTSQTWETSVRVAVETARQNNAGSIPGSLRQLIKQLGEPKISWKEKTQRFIDQSLTKEVSWSRINRRSMASGVLMPGYIADRIRHLVFFADVSGSISIKMIREMVTEIAGALEEGTADQISVVYADTRVIHVDHFYPGDIVEAGVYTGGGTDFADSFKWLKENAPDASCVVYLTDLRVINFGEEPDCPVMWATYARDEDFQSLADCVPFGEAMHISRTYY